MPDDILDCAGPAQMYTTDSFQREIANDPGLKDLTVATTD